MAIKMKTSLDYLPENKRNDLLTTVRLIREEFEVDMIILFGSYARDEWVEELGEDEFYYKYQSDFDILVVAAKKYANKHGKWDRLKANISRASNMPTPVTFIHHNIGFLNGRLSKGHYFFTDIVKEGILLYDSKKVELAEPRELTPEEYKDKAAKYFDHWYNSANDFFEQYEFALTKNKYKIAAFLLHQATERYYSALLLVLTDYRPKSHDIERLGNLAAAQDTELLHVFPKGTKDERNRFELLRKAYIEARYDEDFAITREELEWLAERVNILQKLTEKICKTKIASFIG